MITLDRKDEALIALVCAERSVHTEDERIAQYIDDRGPADDTINRCIKAGRIKQVGDYDADNFALVPGWWPYANQERADEVKRRRDARIS